MRTNDDIRSVTEAAFGPFRCVTEIWDYDHKLRFKVFDDRDRGLIEVPDLLLRNLRDDEQLRDILIGARQHITDKGYRLDPWEFR